MFPIVMAMTFCPKVLAGLDRGDPFDSSVDSARSGRRASDITAKPKNTIFFTRTEADMKWTKLALAALASGGLLSQQLVAQQSAQPVAIQEVTYNYVLGDEDGSPSDKSETQKSAAQKGKKSAAQKSKKNGGKKTPMR